LPLGNGAPSIAAGWSAATKRVGCLQRGSIAAIELRIRGRQGHERSDGTPRLRLHLGARFAARPSSKRRVRFKSLARTLTGRRSRGPRKGRPDDIVSHASRAIFTQGGLQRGRTSSDVYSPFSLSGRAARTRVIGRGADRRANPIITICCALRGVADRYAGLPQLYPHEPPLAPKLGKLRGEKEDRGPSSQGPICARCATRTFPSPRERPDRRHRCRS